MEKNAEFQKIKAAREASAGTRWPWWFLGACLLVFVIGMFLWPRQNNSSATGAVTNTRRENESGGNAARSTSRRVVPGYGPVSAQSAEQIVAEKVIQFGRNRRELARAIARRSHQPVPSEIERFFEAIESGDWERIHAQWDTMAKRSGQYEGSGHSPELDPYWPAVLDAYGVAEQAHLWPAQKLLDYGNAILGSLRPGMVYVGGTDNGRWIPELLNETGDGERHIIITQNALADGRYLEFMTELYGGQFSALTQDDSQRAFQEYMDDAQKRLTHDQQSPAEPGQLRPGEDVKLTDGLVQVSGQVAVMAINERLLLMLMAKNPDLSFALQESFPLKETYAAAAPLGPLMELRAQDGQNAFTPERAGQTLDYWRNEAQQILADPDAVASPATLKSYSHDTVAAANLLAAHDFVAEAEQAYRLATQLWPSN